MGGLITKDERERRISSILSFTFLFRYVTLRDLNLLGNLIGVNDMRRTIEYLLGQKLIKSFNILAPFKTTGYYLTDDALAKLPKFAKYNYAFWPARFRPSTFGHETGVRDACLWVHKAAHTVGKEGRLVSEWMMRQDRVKASGNDVKKLVWRKKSPLLGRVADGMYVVGKGARIAIEYEGNSKNTKAWIGMINDLQYQMTFKEKVDLDTLDMIHKRDFEAILFVFNDKNMFESYLGRFDEYSRTRKLGNLNMDFVRAEIVSPKRFFFTTLDQLKDGTVYRVRKEAITFGEVCDYVENEGNEVD